MTNSIPLRVRYFAAMKAITSEIPVASAIFIVLAVALFSIFIHSGYVDWSAEYPFLLLSVAIGSAAFIVIIFLSFFMYGWSSRYYQSRYFNRLNKDCDRTIKACQRLGSEGYFLSDFTINNRCWEISNLDFSDQKAVSLRIKDIYRIFCLEQRALLGEAGFDDDFLASKMFLERSNECFSNSVDRFNAHIQNELEKKGFLTAGFACELMKKETSLLRGQIIDSEIGCMGMKKAFIQRQEGLEELTKIYEFSLG